MNERRTAIITGAGSGIGLAAAMALHADGFSIVAAGRDVAKLARLSEEIDDVANVQTIVVNLNEPAAASDIVGQAMRRFGRIDALINNAGIGSPKPLDETDDATLDAFLQISLIAPFRLCREALPHMGNGGSIVNVTSTFAHTGGRRGGAYSAAKGGLKSLTEHMACEYGPRGIRSNCVAPGVTMTEMVAHRFNDETFRRTTVETTPYPRIASPDDIASVIAFLCGTGSEMINGQSIIVDGGWTATKYLSPRVTRTKWIEPEDDVAS